MTRSAGTMKLHGLLFLRLVPDDDPMGHVPDERLARKVIPAADAEGRAQPEAESRAQLFNCDEPR